MNEVFELGESGVGSDVVIRGWIRTMRSAQKGKLLFLAINDGSCQASLQVLSICYTFESVNRVDIQVSSPPFLGSGECKRYHWF